MPALYDIILMAVFIVCIVYYFARAKLLDDTEFFIIVFILVLILWQVCKHNTIEYFASDVCKEHVDIIKTCSGAMLKKYKDMFVSKTVPRIKNYIKLVRNMFLSAE